jgi:ubiquinone/menaquinone biosynthesis C-methylase UbiE
MSTTERDDSFMAQFRCPTGSQGREVAALMNQEHDQLTKWGLSHVKVDSRFVILDVGCGGGRTVGKLADLAVEGWVFGVDYSKDMVEFSKEKNRKLIAEGKIQLLQGSVEKLSFPKGFFDLVTAVENFYFWHNLLGAFQELHRVLKSGGWLLLVNEMIKDGRYEVDNAQTITRAHVRLLALEELETLLRSAGFCKVEILRKARSPWNVLLAKKA